MQDQFDALSSKVDAIVGGNITAPPATSTPTTLTTAPEVPTTPPPAAKKVVITDPNGVNVRADASAAAKRLGIVAQGDKLDYLDAKTAADGLWYKIRFVDADGKSAEGWVAGWLSALE